MGRWACRGFRPAPRKLRQSRVDALDDPLDFLGRASGGVGVRLAQKPPVEAVWRLVLGSAIISRCGAEIVSTIDDGRY